MTRLMIDVATGYTGRMAAAHARAAGLDLILAGRDQALLAELGRVLAPSTGRSDWMTMRRSTWPCMTSRCC